MTTDLILGDTDVDIVAQNVSLRRDDTEDSSIGVNFVNKTGFWHISGPRTYEGKGNPLSVFWNNLTDWIGPMLSIQTDGRVKIGAAVTVDPTGRLGVGTDSPESSLHVHGQEVHATGPVGGYSFQDRDVQGKADDGTGGQRWVWYASKKVARLWSGGTDRVTVSSSGALKAGGGVVISNGTILLPGLDSSTQVVPTTNTSLQSSVSAQTVAQSVSELLDDPGNLASSIGSGQQLFDVSHFVAQTDLCKVIAGLRTRIDHLEQQVAALQTPANA